MQSELHSLQLLTLGSIFVLVLLCAALLGLVWLVANLSQLCERLRATLGRGEGREVRGERREPEGASAASACNSGVVDSNRFAPRYLARVIEELNYIHGTGTVVPVGAILNLQYHFETFHGRRWAAKWKSIHLNSVPEDMIEPYEEKQP